MTTKILVLASNPEDTARLRLDQEIREIKRILKCSQRREEFDVELIFAAQIEDLQESILKEKPRIVHFCGHGAGSEELILEAKSGKYQLVNNQALGGLFKLVETQVECVMLNACYSQVQAVEINQHINYVIGTKKQIKDEAAISFTQGFYTALFNGETIERAYEFGCNRIQLEIYRSGDRERKLVPVYSGERGDLVELPQDEVLVLLKKEPLHQIETEPVDNNQSESRGDSPRNTQIGEGNYIENLHGDYYENSPLGVQEIFKNVRAGRDITVGDITQIYKIVVNLDNIPKPKGYPQNIISSSTDKFVGREKDLESLNQKLKRENEVVIAAVEGMGGVGKTELTIQYSLLNLQLNTYPGGICWLRSREADIGSQIVNFVRTDLGLKPPEDLEMPDRVRWCWKHWQSGKTLVVLDDVKNYSDIKPYLPPQPSQFKVLITTRLKLDLPSSLYLEVLEEEEAVELLRQLIGEEKVSQELETAEELCQRLGCLPLALQLVGRYVKKRKISLAEELRRLEVKGLGHPSLGVSENDSTGTLDIKSGVAAAFELSWDELNEPAQALGSYLSLFGSEPFKWSWVEEVWLDDQFQKTKSWPQFLWSQSQKLVDLLLKRQTPGIKEQAEAKNPREILENSREEELVERHLLKVTIEGDSQSSQEPQYQLHALIAEYFGAKLEESEEAEELKQKFCQPMIAIARSIPQAPTQEDIRRVAWAIPHLSMVAKELTDYVDEENLIWSFLGLGRFYSGQGAYERAEEWYEESLKICRNRWGEEHPDVAKSINDLAGLYYSQGRYEEAEPLFREALAIAEKVLGENHPTTETIRGNWQEAIMRRLLEMPEEELKKVLPKEAYEELLQLKKQMGEQELQ